MVTEMNSTRYFVSAIQMAESFYWGHNLLVRSKTFICNNLFCLIIIFLFVWWSTILADAQGPPFNKELTSIVENELQSGMVASIQVAELGSGKILMETNPDLPLVPASTLKIITSACALSYLGPDYIYRTNVYADGWNGSSVKSLYVKGAGDPHFVTEDLFLLTRMIADKGLVEVRGSIIVDDSFFEPGKPVDENEELGTRAYHAPYSALSLNFNSVKVSAIASSRVGQAARVILDPASQYFELRSNVMTVEGSRPCQFDINKTSTPEGKELLAISGSIGVDSQSRSRYVNVSNPSLYFGYTLKEFLQREGIKIQGNVVPGRVPDSATLICDYPSKPMSSIIYWLNKFSNNFMAEQVCLTLGATALGVPGTREKGLEVLKRYLLKCGVSDSQFSLSDASGLSRGNKVSASTLVKVLLTSVGDFNYGPEYLSSFAVSGVDGTLKEKFSDANMRRKIRAKTGTLRGVSALAGFGVSKTGRILVFSVLVNSSKPKGFLDQAEKIARSIFNVNFEKK